MSHLNEKNVPDPAGDLPANRAETIAPAEQTPLSRPVSRRRLIRSAGYAVGATFGLGLDGISRAAAAPPKPAKNMPQSAGGAQRDSGKENGDDFAFFLLGDLHLDRLDQHDQAWLQAEKPNDLKQIENYSRITREVAPNLFAELKAHAQTDKRIVFTVHIGDFVEGLAGTPTLAARQARESLDLMEKHGPDKPFLFCKGNHDITGPGAEAAWNEILLPHVTRQLPQITDKAGSCFTVRHGANTRFVYYDAYDNKSLDWLEAALTKRTEQNLFVVIHPPVAPYSARSNWHIFAKPSEAKERTRLLNLLGANRAIVLCGHLHKYGTVVRETPKGRFVQVATLSVIPKASANAADFREGVKEYGPKIAELEPIFSPATRLDRAALLASEAPFIRHFEYADMAGYGIVFVNNGIVTADLYTGLGKRKWRTLNLSALLG